MPKRSHLSLELQARDIFLKSCTMRRKLAELADDVEWLFFAVLPGTNQWAAVSPVGSAQLRKMAIQMLELADEVAAQEKRRRKPN